MRTGFVRNHRGWTAETQRQILLASGVPALRIYIDGANSMSLEGALRAMRNGEALELAGGLRALAGGRKEIIAELEIVEASGKAVMDTQTGARSDRNGAKMLDAALGKLHGERTMPDKAVASKMGKKGGRARAERYRNGRMPDVQAAKIWTRKDGLTNGQKIALMPGWSEGTAYRLLGPSGRPCGNPGRSEVINGNAART